MHPDFVRPFGTWLPQSVLTAGDLRRFDVAQDAAVSGSSGRTVAPPIPYVFGGAGLVLGASTEVTGAVRVRTDGHLVVADEVTFASPRTRVVRVPLLGARRLGTPQIVARDSGISQLFSQGVGVSGANGFLVPIPSSYLHEGATLTRVRVAWHSSATGDLPVNTPFVTLHASSELVVPALFVPSHAYSSGDRARVLVNGYVMARLRCTVGGTSGTAPTTISPLTLGTTVVSGGATFVLEHLYGVIPVLNGYVPWAPSTAVALGEYYAPPGWPVLFRCTSAGSTGGTEPTWPDFSMGLPITDGSVEWTDVGYTGQVLLPATAGAYRKRGATQWVELTPQWNNVIDTSQAYHLRITDESGTGAQPNFYHCAELTFAEINDMRIP